VSGLRSGRVTPFYIAPADPVVYREADGKKHCAYLAAIAFEIDIILIALLIRFGIYCRFRFGDKICQIRQQGPYNGD
jgi:hypothetical protein